MHIKQWFKVSLMASAMCLTAASAEAADVGVSISVGQPGFYGRLDIGEFPYPYPRVIYPRPIIIHRPAIVEYEPLYLRVPPGHARAWGRYCGRYHACDRPVYFVQDRWYHEVYVPQYHEYHRGYDRDHDDWDHDRRREGRGRDHDRGRR